MLQRKHTDLSGRFSDLQLYLTDDGVSLKKCVKCETGKKIKTHMFLIEPKFVCPYRKRTLACDQWCVVGKIKLVSLV